MPVQTSLTASRVEPDRRLRVLIVEDHADYAESLAQLILEWGFDVRTARDGAEAIALYDEFRPEVAMLDLALPHESGYDVARKLREHAGARELFLVVVTGLLAVADQRQSSTVGISHHLVKPVNPQVLHWILSTYQFAEESTLRPSV
jgi:two-component system CheB/CheR fusion protein